MTAGTPASARRLRGSAVVELIVTAPFVIVLLGVAWDLREYAAHRTELVREIYTVAHAVSNEPTHEPDLEPPGAAVQALRTRFMRISDAGRISMAVVTRGTHSGGQPCQDGQPCPPLVHSLWPAPSGVDRWSSGNASRCDAEPALPGVGEHFGELETVLHNEDALGSVADWPSRNIRAEEWWVVVDVCMDPRPGLFYSSIVAPLRVFGASPAMVRRAAWPSFHVRDDCTWC